MSNTNIYSNLFEGKFKKTHLGHNNLIENIYYKFSAATQTERHLFNLVKTYINGKDKNTIKIIDIGCGGGHRELTTYGLTYGLDISKASVDNAKKIYTEATIHDLTKRFPYEDNTFDIAFCSEVIGHISIEDKDKVLSEIERVLKPNGIFVASIETYGKNILTQLLKKKNLYQKYWIDYQGHIGLETPANTIARLSKSFTIVHKTQNSNYILPIDGYMIFSDKIRFLNIFKINILRRLLNLLLYIPYMLSIKLLPIATANDITIMATKK